MKRKILMVLLSVTIVMALSSCGTTSSAISGNVTSETHTEEEFEHKNDKDIIEDGHKNEHQKRPDSKEDAMSK